MRKVLRDEYGVKGWEIRQVGTPSFSFVRSG